ncbi:MAG: 50S ribosomal protein L23 [Candidatus Thermoplasmatota archaeon]|nr:50S ribosomal protein L23 [Candidatus Thermoplasmatota archaeon]
MNPYDIILKPWITEKSMENRLNEPGKSINRLEFIVVRTATKDVVKKAVEQLFDVKVERVNTRITKAGKHASVKLAEGYDAEETSLKLGAF